MSKSTGIWPDGTNGVKWLSVSYWPDGPHEVDVIDVSVLPVSSADELAEALRKSAEAHHDLSGEFEHLENLFPDCQDHHCIEARKTLAHYRAMRDDTKSSETAKETATGCQERNNT